MKIGLALTGGGARGAYQAGVLKGVAEILGPDRNRPFTYLTGTSAGAINATFLASRSENQFEAVQDLWKLWANLTTDQIVKTDAYSIGRIGSQWLKDLMLGGANNSAHTNFLLDASPLRDLMGRAVDFRKMRLNVARQVIGGVAVTTTHFATGTTMTFFDSAEPVEEWRRSTRIGVKSRIRLSHVLASAAIPILFSPVKLDGSFHGDGSIRSGTPLSPAIHLGADRVFAIGVRYQRPIETIIEINREAKMDSIVMADIAGNIMNAAFLDALDGDIERMERINETLSLLPKGQEHPKKLRPIPVMAIRPSTDIATLASAIFVRLPRALRYVLKGIGAAPGRGADMLSYLAFDQVFCSQLLDLGYRDALDQREKISEFFRE